MLSGTPPAPCRAEPGAGPCPNPRWGAGRAWRSRTPSRRSRHPAAGDQAPGSPIRAGTNRLATAPIASTAIAVQVGAPERGWSRPTSCSARTSAANRSCRTLKVRPPARRRPGAAAAASRRSLVSGAWRGPWPPRLGAGCSEWGRCPRRWSSPRQCLTAPATGVSPEEPPRHGEGVCAPGGAVHGAAYAEDQEPNCHGARYAKGHRSGRCAARTAPFARARPRVAEGLVFARARARRGCQSPTGRAVGGVREGAGTQTHDRLSQGGSEPHLPRVKARPARSV